GMFLVSLPYAVLHGGYWSVIFVVIVAFICCYTGRVLITCLYEDGVRVRASYREIAEFVFRSRLGGMVVNAAAITEALMTCILYLVLCGDLMLGCFPEGQLSFTAWVSVSFFCLLPCAALTSLRHVSWISFWNTVTHVIINCIIIVYCLTRAAHWQPQKVQFHVDINTFPISVGIIVFSYTSHIFLPTLESNLMDKSRFGLMMNWTHILSAIFKALFGYIGFVTFAEHTKEVITNNLASEPLKVTVNVALVVKALCSYPLPYFAAANFLESSLFSGWPLPSCWNSTGDFKLWALLPRAALVLFTYVIAITVPHFALLCGLIGSFTGTMLSFVWPAYFHFSLKRHSVSCFVLGLDLLIIGMGLLFGSVGMFVSGRALHKAMSHGYYSPPGNSSALTPIVAMRS
uniref:Aa_trans domain-containing protein n=1 Tax=Macrostomum lignano TaxID=282301 RepID=A0A1I8IPK2_9PLAT